MLDEFVNRLGMFETTLGTLNQPVHKSVWDGQPPVVFTTKVAAATTAVDELKTLAQEQTTTITGSAAQKATEKEEAVEATDLMGDVLAEWFIDQNDEVNLAKVQRSVSYWRRLRDEAFRDAARVVASLAQEVVDGTSSAQAANYGITQAAVDTLTSEIDDFDAYLTAPQQAIAGRKALTQQLRPRFREVEARFESLDRLIGQFGTTAEGRALIAAYQTSRVIRDLGHGPSTPEEPTNLG